MPIHVPAEEQRTGDVERGYHTLVNGDYIGCGIPRSLYDAVIGSQQPTPEGLKLAGRDADSSNLPYAYNGFVSRRGNRIVSANCLTCHATVFDGQLRVGLGESNPDMTRNLLSQVGLARLLIQDPNDLVEFDLWAQRTQTVAPAILAPITGVQTADNIAPILAAHRDPQTLAWSQEPLLEFTPAAPVPIDTPPMWRTKKKNALYYTGAGRGDHGTWLMIASALCVDDVDDARAIREKFADVRAFMNSVEPLPWPAHAPAIDDDKAARGAQVFVNTCARCHGTYGATDDDDTYPNLIIPTEVVGTDPLLAKPAGTFISDMFHGWFERSFFAETARLEPENGYYAPPLDGIWATAPFLHNASVPTLEGVIDSSKRPAFWQRQKDANDQGVFDFDAVGWLVDERTADETDNAGDNKKFIYDTRLPGYGNEGHTFGDGLRDEERADLLEYLKTL